MGDRILTAEVARALQRESKQEGELLAWIVTGSEGEVAARPVTSGRGALPYVLGPVDIHREQTRPLTR